jgi:hypothetical protein
MNIVEFIGFVIVMIAMFIIFARRAFEERKRRENPELYQQEDEDKERALREFLRSLNVDVEDAEELKPEPPPLPPEPQKKPQPAAKLPRRDFKFDSSVETYEKTKGVRSREFESDIEDRELSIYEADLVQSDIFRKHEEGAYVIIEDQYRRSRAGRLLRDLKDPRDMLVYHEILGKPKAMQTHILPHDLAE